jgi:hypothetical protein
MGRTEHHCLESGSIRKAIKREISASLKNRCSKASVVLINEKLWGQDCFTLEIGSSN